MNRRCNRQPGHKDYPHYAGRGIRVCNRWQVFEAFAADMGPHPGKGWTLERKKVTQGYRKSNCIWATMTAQNRNRRFPLRAPDVATIRKLYTGDVRRNRNGLSHQALADMYGVGRTTITNVLLGNTWV